MWKRNFLFWTVCLAALAGLGASLSTEPSRFAEEDADQIHVKEAEWHAVVGRLDQTFAELWEERQVEGAPEADPLQVARRLSLALMGTVPSLEEVRFLQSEPSELRYEQWLEHVLRDGRFHDYFAERLARGFVGTKDGAFIIYRRRRFVSWLSDQLAEERRYDETVRELIASDGLWTDHPATNFVTVTIRPGQDKNQPNENELAAKVSRAFLGVRIDCAECHDHPYDRWKQKDFQGLAAFFAGTRVGLRGIRDQAEEYKVEDRVTGKMQTVPCQTPFQQELLPSAESNKDNSRERLAAWVTSPENRHFSRAIVNRVWALMFGRALVEPVDDIREGVTIPAALDLLADDFAANGFQIRRLIRIIATSQVFHRDSRAAIETSADLTAEQLDTWAAFPISRLRPEQVAGSVIQAASLTTLDQQAHLVFRIGRYIGESDFIKRYGDAGEDELTDVGGTIPQRLLMMNGKLVSEKTKQSPLLNAVTQISLLSPDDEHAIETAYLTVLTRLPTDTEREHFAGRLKARSQNQRLQRLEDLYWALLNSTEFSWNH